MRRCRVVEGVVVVLRVESASVEAAHVVVPWWRRLSIVVSHVDGNLGDETHLLAQDRAPLRQHPAADDLSPLDAILVGIRQAATRRRMTTSRMVLA